MATEISVMYGSEVINQFIDSYRSRLLEIERVFKHQDWQMFGIKLNKCESFSPT